MIIAEQPFLLADSTWMKVRDGHPTALAIFDRHYSSRRAHVRKIDQFVGPGEKMVLLTPDARAIFAWRKFIDDAIDVTTGTRQRGVNCAVFRREGGAPASDLIRAADDLAWERWPGERHYTYVDPSEVRSPNPGYCFLRAGWRRCGLTKGGLLILERLP